MKRPSLVDGSCGRYAALCTLSVALGFAALAACAEKTPTTPESRQGARLVLDSDTASLVAGKTRVFTARIVQIDGSSTLASSARWASSDTSAATVVSGAVTGRSLGEVRITAQVGALSALLRLSVRLPQVSFGAVASDSIAVIVGLGSGVSASRGALPAGVRITVAERTPDAALSPLAISGEAVEVAIEPARLSDTRLRDASTAEPFAWVDLKLRVPIGGLGASAQASPFLGIAWTSPASTPPLLLHPDVFTSSVDELGRTIGEARLRVQVAVTASQRYLVSLVRASTSCEAGTNDLLGGDGSATVNDVAVVFVHGLQLAKRTCELARNFDPLSATWQRLQADVTGSALGLRDVRFYRYASFLPVEGNAASLAALLDQQLPGRRVILISHSMGGLVAMRARQLTKQARVGGLIALGTPWDGSPFSDPSRKSAITTATTVCGAIWGVKVGVGGPVIGGLMGAVFGVGSNALMQAFASASDLAPGSEFLRALRSPSGGAIPVHASSSELIAGRVSVTSPFGCLQKMLGVGDGDGIVPLESALGRIGGTALFSMNSTFDGVSHVYLTDDAGTRQAVISALRRMNAAIAPVRSVVVSPATATVAIGSTHSFIATVTDVVGNALTGRSVTWSSSNTEVATVSSDEGVVRGVAAGTAMVTATSENKTGTATITVIGVTGQALTTDPADAITPSSAQLHGTVFQNGNAYTVWFEWGLSPTLASSNSSATASGPTTSCPGIAYCRWNYSLTALSSNTTYHFRLVARDATGTTRGTIRSFATTSAPVISNLVSTLGTVNNASCVFPTNPSVVGSSYRLTFAYADLDGDVSAAGSPVTLSWVFQPSSSSDSEPWVVSARTGTNYSGTVTISVCTRFGSDTSVKNSVILRDDAGNASNALSVTILKPEGANLQSGSSRAGAMSVLVPPSILR